MILACKNMRAAGMLDNLQVVYIDNYLGQSATVRDRLGKPDLPVLTVGEGRPGGAVGPGGRKAEPNNI